MSLINCEIALRSTYSKCRRGELKRRKGESAKGARCIIERERKTNYPLFRIGIPKATEREPAAHQNDHVRLALRPARASGIMDRTRPELSWTLLHSSCPEDGPLWSIHLSAVGPCPYHHTAKSLPWKNKPQSQDSSNYD